MHGSPTDKEMGAYYARQEMQPEIKRLNAKVASLETQLKERTAQLKKAVADLNNNIL